MKISSHSLQMHPQQHRIITLRPGQPALRLAIPPQALTGGTVLRGPVGVQLPVTAHRQQQAAGRRRQGGFVAAAP